MEGRLSPHHGEVAEGGMSDDDDFDFYDDDEDFEEECAFLVATLRGVRHELTKTGDVEYALLLIHRAIGE